MNKLKKYIRWWKTGIRIVIPALFYAIVIVVVIVISAIALSSLPRQLQAVGMFVVVGLGIFPVVFGYLQDNFEELEKPPWR